MIDPSRYFEPCPPPPDAERAWQLRRLPAVTVRWCGAYMVVDNPYEYELTDEEYEALARLEMVARG